MLPGHQHAEAEFRRVLEEGVGPGRAAAVFVYGISAGGGRVAPDGTAARGVGDIHPRAEQLGQQFHVRGLSAACACPREFHQGAKELASLEGVRAEFLHGFPAGQQRLAVVEEFLVFREVFILFQFFRRNHFQGFGGFFLRGLALSRADGRAGAAAGAVRPGDGDGEGVAVQARHGDGLCPFRRGGQRFPGQGSRADDGVGADEGAAGALDAVFRFPYGKFRGYAAPFVGGASRGVQPSA